MSTSCCLRARAARAAARRTGPAPRRAARSDRRPDLAGLERFVEHAREALQRIAAGAQHADLPVAAGRAHRGHEAGVHERRLADARRTDHGEQRPRIELRERGADLVAAAEEVLRVVFAERGEPAIRARRRRRSRSALRREERLQIARAARSRSGSARLCASRGSDRRSRRARGGSVGSRAPMLGSGVSRSSSRARSLSGVIVPAGCTPVSARQNMMPTAQMSDW